MNRHSTFLNAVLLVGIGVAGGFLSVSGTGVPDDISTHRRLVQQIRKADIRKDAGNTGNETTRIILEENFNKFTDGSISEPGA